MTTIGPFYVSRTTTVANNIPWTNINNINGSPDGNLAVAALEDIFIQTDTFSISGYLATLPNNATHIRPLFTVTCATSSGNAPFRITNSFACTGAIVGITGSTPSFSHTTLSGVSIGSLSADSFSLDTTFVDGAKFKQLVPSLYGVSVSGAVASAALSIDSIALTISYTDPVPDHYNLRAFAQRFLQGDCRCALDGDSINNDGEGGAFYMAYGWVRKISANWKGITCPPLYGGVAPTFNCVEGSNIVEGFGASLVYGTGTAVSGNIWPRKFSRVPATGTFTFATNQPYFTPFYDFYTDPTLMSVFRQGDWFTSATGTRCRFMYYGHTPSVTKVTTEVVRGGQVTDTNFLDLTMDGKVNALDIAIPNSTGNNQLFIKIGTDGNGYATSGQMMTAVGARLYRPNVTNGLEMAFLAVSSSTVAQHNDTNRISAQARSDAVRLLELNTIIIWLGTNDTVSTVSGWQAEVQTLIGKWDTAFAANSVANVKYLLIMPYEYPDIAKLNIEEQALFNIALLDSRISFLNLYRLTMGFNRAAYLEDNIHTNAAGALYFADVINSNMLYSLLDNFQSVGTLDALHCIRNVL